MPERIFWRIVRSNPPIVWDFRSNQERRRRPRDTNPETLRLWSGLSVYASMEAARRTARSFPRIGSFLAQVRLENEDDVRVEKTLGPDHFTLWGDADFLLTRVILVTPVWTSRSEADGHDYNI